jgi:hypothetical protein
VHRLTCLRTLDLSGNELDFGRSKPALAPLTALASLRLAAAGPLPLRLAAVATRALAAAAGPGARGWWAFLPQLSSLAMLDLHGLDMRAFPRLAPHLSHCTALRILLLGGGVHAYCAPALAAALAPLTRLEFLNVNNSHLLEPAGEAELAAALAKLPALGALSLSWNVHPDEAGMPLALNHKALPRIRALDLSDTAEVWQAGSARSLAKKLRRLPALEVVNLGRPWCEAGAVRALHAAEPPLARIAATRMAVRELADVALGAHFKGRPILPALGALRGGE